VDQLTLSVTRSQMEVSARSWVLDVGQAGQRGLRHLPMVCHRRKIVNAHQHHGINHNRGSSRSGGCPSQLVASWIHQLLASNTLQQHILRVLQPAYARRYHVMMAAITKHLLPLGVSTHQANADVAGGYFIWLKLPEPLKSEAVTRKAAKEQELIISDGNAFQVQGDEKSGISFQSNIRLCFSYETEENLVEGVERLARLVKKDLGSSQSS
jgi:DNA-binding transcriptional MocR family regulator